MQGLASAHCGPACLQILVYHSKQQPPLTLRYLIRISVRLEDVARSAKRLYVVGGMTATTGQGLDMVEVHIPTFQGP